MGENGFNFSMLDLALFPVTFPVKGLMFVLEQLRETVDRELYDEKALQRKLMELDLAYEMGDIGESEYLRMRPQITERLKALIMMKKQLQEEEQEG